MLLLIRKLLRWRNTKPIPPDPTAAAPIPPSARPGTPEWQCVLTSPIAQHSVAPSEDVIVHAFDLYSEARFAPLLERELRLANLDADILGDVAELQAQVPHLIERAISRHPYEFSHIIDHKEDE